MTVLNPPVARPTSRVLTTDFDALRDLADQLNGRPVPNVRMTEQQFVDWQPEGIRAEWENGQVILTTTPSDEHQELNLWMGRLLCEFVEEPDWGAVMLPFAVRLPSQKRRREPDLIYIAKTTA